MTRAPRPTSRQKRGRTYLIDWRKHRGHTQEEVADLLELCEQFTLAAASLSRMERGVTPYSQDVLEALARVYKCAPADLIGRGPASPSGVDVAGLSPDQMQLVQALVDQLRRRPNEA